MSRNGIFVDDISILHKYDSNQTLVDSLPEGTKISILHKYDSNEVAETVVVAAHKFQFYISTILTVVRHTCRILLTHFNST